MKSSTEETDWDIPRTGWLEDLEINDTFPDEFIRRIPKVRAILKRDAFFG